ncbi:LegC family aminotransferase [Prochlorococcus sp. MIT 1011]|uniref:LegC family aminotransferase n=1 Tax=Prochlorococcus sp. MIT 1011 TaxID=3082520 RepID=UPI0039B39327
MIANRNYIKILDLIKDSINLDKHSLPIQLHEPDFNQTNSLSYLSDCIETGWVSSAGKWVNEFENKLCEFTGARYAIAVVNGTAALRLALHLVGVRAGDEVILPPMSFVATANAISHLGAVPHFVDIENESLGLCPLEVKERLDSIALKVNNHVINRETGRKISAILPVHIFGTPSKILELLNISEEWNIPLVEDAAEALGSFKYDNKKLIHCGLFGKLGILSFNGNKILTTGGGGALITNDQKIAKLARHLSTTAKKNHKWDFYHDYVGWNDRLPNINAALGVAQIEDLASRIEKKRNLHKKYSEKFELFNELEILKPSDDCISNYWLITLRLNLSKAILEEYRIGLLELAHESGILLRPVWRLLNELPMYQNSPKGQLKVAEDMSKRLINLPSSPQLL